MEKKKVKMNPKVKKLWIAALKSGKYKQGVGALKTNDDKYCCLGVLCDIYRKEKKVKGFIKNINNKYEFQNSSGILSDKVMNWAKLEDRNPDISTGKSLAVINDNGTTFKEIADIIKKEF